MDCLVFEKAQLVVARGAFSLEVSVLGRGKVPAVLGDGHLRVLEKLDVVVFWGARRSRDASFADLPVLALRVLDGDEAVLGFEAVDLGSRLVAFEEAGWEGVDETVLTSQSETWTVHNFEDEERLGIFRGFVSAWLQVAVHLLGQVLAVGALQSDRVSDERDLELSVVSGGLRVGVNATFVDHPELVLAGSHRKLTSAQRFELEDFSVRDLVAGSDRGSNFDALLDGELLAVVGREDDLWVRVFHLVSLVGTDRRLGGLAETRGSEGSHELAVVGLERDEAAVELEDELAGVVCVRLECAGGRQVGAIRRLDAVPSPFFCVPEANRDHSIVTPWDFLVSGERSLAVIEVNVGVTLLVLQGDHRVHGKTDGPETVHGDLLCEGSEVFARAASVPSVLFGPESPFAGWLGFNDEGFFFTWGFRVGQELTISVDGEVLAKVRSDEDGFRVGCTSLFEEKDFLLLHDAGGADNLGSEDFGGKVLAGGVKEAGDHR